MADPSDRAIAEAQRLTARAVRARQRLAASSADVAESIAQLTRALDSSGEAEAKELQRTLAGLWRVREAHAVGMRDTSFTYEEIANAFGVSVNMTRKIVANGRRRT